MSFFATCEQHSATVWNCNSSWF